MKDLTEADGFSVKCINLGYGPGVRAPDAFALMSGYVLWGSRKLYCCWH